MDTQFSAQEILVTACEGGIGYWSQLTSYHPSKSTAAITDITTGKSHAIDATVIERGRKLILDRKVKIDPVIRADILIDEIDAIAADCIVQAGLFGEIRYS